MLKLNRSKDFGKVTPAWNGPGFDRPAYYEQDDKYFDQYDREIIPGQPLAPEVKAAEPTPPTALLSPRQLVDRVDTMPWALFRKEAKRILGDVCPANKTDILVALKKAIAGYQARIDKRSSTPPPAVGMSWGQMTGETPPAAEDDDEVDNEPPAPAPAPAPAKSTGIDLAAWGRGTQDYLFHLVQKEIRAKYHAQVTKRQDAVDILIQEKLITAAEARRDID